MAQSATVGAGTGPAKPVVVIHEVTAIDSLGSICAHYDADTDLVRRANSIPSTSDYIGTIGRKLRVPTATESIMPALPDEPTRRAGLLHSFALRNGLSNEDAGVFLRLGQWDMVKAQQELDDTAEPAHVPEKAADDSAMAPKVHPLALPSGSVGVRDSPAREAAARHPEEPDTGASGLRDRRPLLGSAIVIPEGV
jgi:hypothetical protein